MFKRHKRDACGSGRLKHPFDGKNDVTDIDQDEKNEFKPSHGVTEETIITNLMNSAANPNKSLRPTNNKNLNITKGQRKKAVETVPEKKEK